MRIVQARQAARAKPPRRNKGAWHHAIQRLADPTACQIAEIGKIRSFAKDSLLIRESDTSGDLFVILAGAVAVFVANPDGREMILAHYRPPAFVGEMALDGAPRSASVRAVEPTVCAVVTRRALRRAIGADPQIALRLFATAAQRVRSATGVVKSLALSNVYRRVAGLLDSLEYIEMDGALWTREPLRQRDIANRVGASRDMISRVLKQLRLGGYIAMRERRISVLRRPPARW